MTIACSPVVTEARLLRDAGKLLPYEQAWLQKIYGEDLPTPPFSARKFPRAALAWFKTDAEQSIGRVGTWWRSWRTNDVAVRLPKSSNPGKVVHEDAHQVLVEECDTSSPPGRRRPS